MEHVINLKQKLTKTGNASYTVKMTVDNEALEFHYSDCNAIYPLYNSLIKIITDMENVHVELDTSDKRFAHEIMGNPNKNARMLEILKNIQERQNITIDAY